MQRKHQQVLSKEYDAHQNDPVKDLDSVKLQQGLRVAISKLPDYLGDVVVLRDLAQMPYAQVAAILGIRLAVARVYRHKAIKLLARWEYLYS